MNNINSYPLHMKSQEIRSLPAQPGQQIRVIQGRLWLTAIGDFMDYVVKEGEVIEIPNDKTGILLQSLSENLELEIQQCA